MTPRALEPSLASISNQPRPDLLNEGLLKQAVLLCAKLEADTSDVRALRGKLEVLQER